MSSRKHAHLTPSHHQHKSGNSHTFPILPLDEILLCLQELNINVEEADITKPEHTVMRMVYENFVDLLMGVTNGDINQPNVFGAIEVLENPELHEESLSRLHFHKHLLRLMSTVGVADFVMADVTSPDYKPRPNRTPFVGPRYRKHW